MYRLYKLFDFQIIFSPSDSNLKSRRFIREYLLRPPFLSLPPHSHGSPPAPLLINLDRKTINYNTNKPIKSNGSCYVFPPHYFQLNRSIFLHIVSDR